MKTKILIVLVAWSLSTTLSFAGLITFDFVDFGSGQAGIDLDGLETGTTAATDGILTLTMTALAEGTGGGGDVFNQTSTLFGINASGGNDVTDAFDDGSGVSEYMVFSFDLPGIIVSMDFEGFTGSGQTGEDAAFLDFQNSARIDFHDDSMDNQSTDYLTVNRSYVAGEEITLGWSDGNGYGLQQITVDVVPEPSTMALFGLGAALVTLSRRRAKKIH